MQLATQPRQSKSNFERGGGREKSFFPLLKKQAHRKKPSSNRPAKYQRRDLLPWVRSDLFRVVDWVTGERRSKLGRGGLEIKNTFFGGGGAFSSGASCPLQANWSWVRCVARGGGVSHLSKGLLISTSSLSLPPPKPRGAEKGRVGRGEKEVLSNLSSLNSTDLLRKSLV